MGATIIFPHLFLSEYGHTTILNMEQSDTAIHLYRKASPFRFKSLLTYNFLQHFGSFWSIFTIERLGILEISTLLNAALAKCHDHAV